MKSNPEVTPSLLTKPEVQLVDCSQHPLHIVGQILLTLKLNTEGTGQKVEVLINTSDAQTCLLGTNAQEELGIALVQANGEKLCCSAVSSAQPCANNKPDAEEGTEHNRSPHTPPTLTVSLVQTCQIPGY